MSVRLFQDSGAPTLYNEFMKKAKTKVMGATLKNRRHDQYEFLDSDIYKKYRERYLQHLLKNQDNLEVAVNLDIINNAEATYQNQKWFEERGAKVLPVWHFGTDERYLNRYIDEGYDYIAIGGLIPNASSVLVGPLDKLWGHTLCDRVGRPRVRIHGFAMTAFELMRRYPWYSVDSSSWLKVGAYGKIFMPKKDRRGIWRWDKNPVAFVISEVGRGKGLGANESPAYRKAVFELIEECGFPIGKNREIAGRLVTKEEGLINSYLWRTKWNIFHMQQFLKTLPSWPWNFVTERHELL